MKYKISLTATVFFTMSHAVFASSIDSNNDGKLVEAEIKTYIDTHLQEIKEKILIQGVSIKDSENGTLGTGIDTYD